MCLPLKTASLGHKRGNSDFFLYLDREVCNVMQNNVKRICMNIQVHTCLFAINCSI